MSDRTQYGLKIRAPRIVIVQCSRNCLTGDNVHKTLENHYISKNTNSRPCSDSSASRQSHICRVARTHDIALESTLEDNVAFMQRVLGPRSKHHAVETYSSTPSVNKSEGSFTTCSVSEATTRIPEARGHGFPHQVSRRVIDDSSPSLFRDRRQIMDLGSNRQRIIQLTDQENKRRIEFGV